MSCNEQKDSRKLPQKMEEKCSDGVQKGFMPNFGRTILLYSTKTSRKITT